APTSSASSSRLRAPPRTPSPPTAEAAEPPAAPHRPPTTDHRPPTNLNITTTNRRDPMKTRHALTTALAAGAALTLAGCGGGCDTVDSDDFDSYMEGEVADGFPAFDTVEGECQAGDDSVSIAAVVPHDVKGEEFLEAMGEQDSEGYAVQSGKWVVLVDGTDE